CVGRLQARTTGQDHPVDTEHHDRADHGHDEARRLALAVEAHHATQPTTQHGADDAEHDRDDDATRVTPRHDELGYDADHQAEDDPQENVHRLFTPFKGEREAGLLHTDGRRLHARCHGSGAAVTG